MTYRSSQPCRTRGGRRGPRRGPYQRGPPNIRVEVRDHLAGVDLAGDRFAAVAYAAHAVG
eukprot:8025094-Pyramimonas_sp.AAC.2